MPKKSQYDVIIIGGSYAGLSAAMTLGRSLREVLILDSGKPCNSSTPKSHNFITQDGETPAAIAEKAKSQVLKYPTVTFNSELALAANRTAAGFTVATSTENRYRAKKLIFATGIRDLLPNIPDFADLWGKTIVHCPYCHGYELKERKTALLAHGEKALHMAPLIHNLTANLSILTHGESTFTEEQKQLFQQHGIPILNDKIVRIVGESGQIRQLVFEGGNTFPLDALYAPLPFEQHSDIPKSLGCALTEQGHIEVDTFQRTTVDGVFACGDNCSPMRSVANAVSSGNIAGAVVNKILADEKFNVL